MKHTTQGLAVLVADGQLQLLVALHVLGRLVEDRRPHISSLCNGRCNLCDSCHELLFPPEAVRRIFVESTSLLQQHRFAPLLPQRARNAVDRSHKSLRVQSQTLRTGLAEISARGEQKRGGENKGINVRSCA